MKQTGKLTSEQFALAMWLIQQKLAGKDPPAQLTSEMIPPSMRPDSTQPSNVSYLHLRLTFLANSAALYSLLLTLALIFRVLSSFQIIKYFTGNFSSSNNLLLSVQNSAPKQSKAIASYTIFIRLYIHLESL